MEVSAQGRSRAFNIGDDKATVEAIGRDAVRRDGLEHVTKRRDGTIRKQHLSATGTRESPGSGLEAFEAMSTPSAPPAHSDRAGRVSAVENRTFTAKP